MNEEKKCWDGDMETLATYIGESSLYRSPRLMHIQGKQDAKPGSVGTIVSPRQAEGITIDSGLPDVKVFSFVWKGQLRQLLVKIVSQGGNPSSCTVRLIKPRGFRRWESLSGDVVIGSGSGSSFTPLLFNPRALVEWGDVIYLIDYESQRIVILGEDELLGLSGNYEPLKPPFNLEGDLDQLKAKGQALIALGDKLYALYLVADDLFPPNHGPGILCRLGIKSDGNLAFEAQTTVGFNPQSIVPVFDGTAMQLLVPAIGGAQKSDGTTNTTFSNICCVPAIGNWTTPATVLITGDSAGASPMTYDIQAVAAGTRGRTNMLYILTQIYNGSNALWRIYGITVGDFLDLGGGSSIPTLSTAANLTDLDEGTLTSIAYGGIYFWDLLYSQTNEVSDAGDLLWAALGTPILVTRAAAKGYGAPDSGTDNAYIMFGFNGGKNVNDIDLTVEATNQEKRGGVSLKRGLNGSAYAGPGTSN
jgi:hypothetical protein